MFRVILLTARWCNICPSAKAFWRELKSSDYFEYEEVDAGSEKGVQLIEKYSIATVPTSIIDGRVVLGGVPTREQLGRLLKPLRTTLEAFQ